MFWPGVVRFNSIQRKGMARKSTNVNVVHNVSAVYKDRSVAVTASAAIRRLGRPVFEIVQHLLFAHIAVADQQELQQVIVFLLLRTTVGFKRHANSGTARRQVIRPRDGRLAAGRLHTMRARHQRPGRV